LEAARSGGNFKYPVPNAGKAIDLQECLLADSKHFFAKLYKACMKIIYHYSIIKVHGLSDIYCML
jgi:hypothetical protein